jgi:hypothetical protein
MVNKWLVMNELGLKVAKVLTKYRQGYEYRFKAAKFHHEI